MVIAARGPAKAPPLRGPSPSEFAPAATAPGTGATNPAPVNAASIPKKSRRFQSFICLCFKVININKYLSCLEILQDHKTFAHFLQEFLSSEHPHHPCLPVSFPGIWIQHFFHSVLVKIGIPGPCLFLHPQLQAKRILLLPESGPVKAVPVDHHHSLRFCALLILIV
jgi:hypothetical protein